MEIKLKINDKPELKMCKMSCDRQLHPKLEEYEVTKFLNMHSCSAFIGRMGSGKTSLVESMFKHVLNKVYDNIFLFIPEKSLESMKKSIFNVLPAEHVLHSLDDLPEVFNVIKSADPDENHCVIFDDMSAELKKKENIPILRELIFNMRHNHVSIYTVCQSYKSIPRDLRQVMSNMFIFKVANSVLLTIMEELCEDLSNKHFVKQLTKIIYDKPHEYLFINTNTHRLFKKWDELIITEN